MQGYATPADQVVNVTAGNTTIVTGTFVPQALLRVLTSPAVPGTITIDGIRRNDWGVWTYFPPGAHQVCFLAVLAFLPPTCQNINLAAGTGNADVTGVYTASGGAPGEPGPLGELEGDDVARAPEPDLGGRQHHPTTGGLRGSRRAPALTSSASATSRATRRPPT